MRVRWSLISELYCRSYHNLSVTTGLNTPCNIEPTNAFCGLWLYFLPLKMRKCCRHTSLLTREYLFSAKGKIKYKNQDISEFEGSYSCIWKFYIIRRVCATLLLNIPQAFYGVHCDLLMEKEQTFYLSINTAIKASHFLFHELPVRVNIFTHVDLLPARETPAVSKISSQAWSFTINLN